MDQKQKVAAMPPFLQTNKGGTKNYLVEICIYQTFLGQVSL